MVPAPTSLAISTRPPWSSIIDFTTFKTVRIGVCYDKLCEIFLKFDIDLKKNGMA